MQTTHFEHLTWLVGSAPLVGISVACATSTNGSLPLGYTDIKPTSTITGVSRLSFQGWAASEDGVSKVCFFF